MGSLGAGWPTRHPGSSPFLVSWRECHSTPNRPLVVNRQRRPLTPAFLGLGTFAASASILRWLRLRFSSSGSRGDRACTPSRRNRAPSATAGRFAEHTAWAPVVSKSPHSPPQPVQVRPLVEPVRAARLGERDGPLAERPGVFGESMDSDPGSQIQQALVLVKGSAGPVARAVDGRRARLDPAVASGWLGSKQEESDD